MSNAFGTVARSAAVVTTGVLYDEFGFSASLTFTVASIGLAAGALLIGARVPLAPHHTR
ncbi:MAG TPA: hypothetical protein VMM60_02975 [Ilumatobacter sp.]|nr:hypothetical protein [Ilumatobacter sp.]